MRGGAIMIDLHVHTTASDGTYSPEEVVRLAAEKGIRAVAITDHDTTLGIQSAIIAGKAHGVEVIPGVEISVRWNGGTMHMLGYFVKEDAEFLDSLRFLREGRQQRIPRILDKLTSLGISLTEADVYDASKAGSPGRPHVANALVNKGYVSSREEAFSRFLGKGAPAYVEKVKLGPLKSIEIILKAGGVPVLAHPYSLNEPDPSRLRQILASLIPFGLKGIEAHYPEHSLEQTKTYLELAEDLGLLVTGGTDFHGQNKPNVDLGCIPVTGHIPYSFLENLKEVSGRA